MNASTVRNLLCLCFFFALISFVNSTTRCSEEEPCPGARPCAPNGLCPTSAGQTCGLIGGEETGYCDEELGFACVEPTPGEEGGICKGPFGLTAGEVTYTTIHITWEDFAPWNYEYEYIVFWTNYFQGNLTEWNQIQVGRVPPSTTLKKLEQNTLYFIRVGTWGNPQVHQYKNLSEIIMVTTMGGCHLEGETWLELGGQRVTECESICFCLLNGTLNCEELCPGRISVNPGDQPNCSWVSAGEEYDECCTDLVCTDGSCAGSENGTRYSNNTRYTTQCSTCLCLNGEITCSDLYECENTNRLMSCLRRVEVEPENCCPEYECLSECVEGNVTYEHGDTVIRGCNERCTCQNGWVGCEKICPELDLSPTDHCLHPVRAFPPGERCAIVQCAGSDTVSCVIEGVSQVVDEPRVTERCHQCTCLDEHSYQCNRGCYRDIEEVQPNSACPRPQFVLLEGECCPQIWCHAANNLTESVPNMIKLLKVAWATKQSLIIEFDTPATGDLNGTLLGYHIFFSEGDAVATTGTKGWNHRFLGVNETQELFSVNSSEEGLNDSFVPGTTVRATLDGLNPGETYFVRVKIGLSPDNDGGLSPLNALKEMNHAGAALSVIAVAPPITGYKCWVKDRYINHGEQYQDGCDVICRCSYGELSCEPVCPVDPPTCPRPVERLTAGECCGRTKCYGKPGCCPYGNTTLEDGDIVRESCERYCRCVNGTVTCWPVCSHLKPPRPECTKMYYKDRCCPTWRCPSEKKPPFAIEARVTLKVYGVCDDQNKQFLQEISHSIMNRFWREGLCTARSENKSLVVCSDSQFAAVCPHDQHGGAPTATILIFVTVKVFNKGLDADFRGGPQLREVVGRIRNMTTSGMTVTVRDVTYPVMTMVDVSDIMVICQQGYLKHDDGCMAGHVVSSNRSASYHVVIHVINVTEFTARLRWAGLPHDHLQYLDALRLEYRDIVANGTWLTTEKLHVSRTEYVLRGLSPIRLYVVRLLLLTSSPGLGRYTAASSVFKTLYIKAISRPEITGMDVSSSSVTVRWSAIPVELRRFAEEYFLAFSKVSKEGQAFPYKRTTSLAPSVTEYTLQALAPDTIYKVKVALVLSNRTTVFSLSADVRTKQAEVSGFISHRGVIIGVSSVALLAVAALITLLVCIFKMRRASSRLSVSSSENNFENKMFDMDTSAENTSWNKPAN